jgi:thiamine kinase-like enzyme
LDGITREAVEKAFSRTHALEVALQSWPRTLLHHDMRADNLFWGDMKAPGGVIFVDWQMVGQGVGPIDLAWFASTSVLEPGDPRRFAMNQKLLEVYWRSLTEAGVDGARYPLEAAWRDYLLGFVWSFLVIIQAVKFGEPNEVLNTFVSRVTHAMAELGAENVPCERLI